MQVDAAALTAERDKIVDTVIEPLRGSSRSREPYLRRLAGYRYLVARNPGDEGFYLIWGGPGGNADFTEEVYEACVAEGAGAGLHPVYHVYSRYNLFATPGVRWYQLPGKVLSSIRPDVPGGCAGG